MDKAQLLAAKIEAKKLFMSFQYFMGIGIGEDCLHIYVENESDLVHVPKSIEGVPVKAIVTGKIVAQ